MNIARSMKAAVAAAVLAAGAVTGTPAWAERGHDRHGHRHHNHGHDNHGDSRSNAAAVLGFGLLAGALALALSEPQPAPRVVYTSPPVVYTPPAPPVYVEQAMWYCPAPAGYYPHVANCPSGWTRVVPPG